MEALRRVVEADARLGYAVVFGSKARGEQHAGSDIDVAIGASEGRKLSVLDLGDIASRLEAAAGRPIDVADLESAPAALAYRVFRDGHVILERERARLVARDEPARCSSISTSSRSRITSYEACSPPPRVVDSSAPAPILAAGRVAGNSKRKLPIPSHR